MILHILVLNGKYKNIECYKYMGRAVLKGKTLIYKWLLKNILLIYNKHDVILIKK